MKRCKTGDGAGDLRAGAPLPFRAGASLPILLAVIVTLGSTLLAGTGVVADTVTIGPAKDNTLYEYTTTFGDRSNGGGSYFFAGLTEQGRFRRGMVKFDVAAVVPAGSTITSVTLRLNMSKTSSLTFGVSLHRILADWGEGIANADNNEGVGAPAQTGDATWDHRFYDTILWGTAGGDFTAAASASQTVNGTGPYTWSSSGLVADVQFWLDSPSSNFGWLVHGDESTAQTTKRFDSRENSPTRRPQLTVIYTLPPPTGGCCVPVGTCSVLSQIACTSQGGTYQGNGAACSPNPCPQPPPAVPDGSAGSSPMTVSKLDAAGTSLSITWDTTTCSGNPKVHQILYGQASQLPTTPAGAFGLEGSVCGVGSTSPFVWNPAPSPSDGRGLIWWLIAVRDGSSHEGSWGRNSVSAERIGPGPGGSSGQCGVADRILSNSCGH